MNSNQVLFYDKTGQPVYSPAMASGQARMVGGAITLPPIGNYCADANSFIIPDSFTMVADNTAGVAPVTFKHTSFDNVVEAILGSLGASFFTIRELALGNGSIAQQDGTFIFADDSLRRFTATYAVAISEIVLTGTQTTGLSEQLMNVFKGNLTTVDRSTIKLILDESNATATPVLKFKGLWYLTSNKAFTLTVGTGLIANLRFNVAGFKPYTELF